jgi:hypothetical protein
VLLNKGIEMTFINQQYAIVGQVKSISRGDGPMTTVNMRGVQDNKHYHTYVVYKYRNRRHWQDIIDNPGQGHIVTFSNGALNKPGQIDADSVPEIAISAPTVDIHAVVDELHGIKPKRRKPTQDEVMAQFARMETMMKDLFE